uniref:Uncharacterized protein n=1 Tax=Cucumis melo TaxID=3656 RepID=A0A9I9E5D1_CUCME
MKPTNRKPKRFGGNDVGVKPSTKRVRVSECERDGLERYIDGFRREAKGVFDGRELIFRLQKRNGETSHTEGRQIDNRRVEGEEERRKIIWKEKRDQRKDEYGLKEMMRERNRQVGR